MAAFRGWIGQESNKVELRRECDHHLIKMFDKVKEVRKDFPIGNNDSLVCAAIKIDGVNKVKYFVSRHDPSYIGPDPLKRYISHAEREAINWAITEYGIDAVRGAILLTTLSPCTLSGEIMTDRIGCSCHDRATALDLRVYYAVHDSYQSPAPRLKITGPSRTHNRSLVMRGSYNRRRIMDPESAAKQNTF